MSQFFYLQDSLAPISVNGRTIVIKYGGSAMSTAEASAFTRDVAALKNAGARVVVVHGGGSAITATATQLGVQTTFVDGQRYTDDAMIDVVMMVLAGRINKEIVQKLCSSGASAVGLSGVDGRLLTCVALSSPSVDLGRVGTVTKVRTELILLLLESGEVPVIAPAAVDETGTVHNVNADLAASAIAGALGADMLLFMSDVPGIRVDGEIVSVMTTDQAQAHIESGTITDGMIPKVNAALDALHAGVLRVRIVDGRIEGVVRQAFLDDDIGTELFAPSPMAANGT